MYINNPASIPFPLMGKVQRHTYIINHFVSAMRDIYPHRELGRLRMRLLCDLGLDYRIVWKCTVALRVMNALSQGTGQHKRIEAMMAAYSIADMFAGEQRAARAVTRLVGRLIQ